MERVVKRYLMHNQGDSEDPKQNDFDELKQDLQQIKYEIVNDMKKSREDSIRNAFIINNGIQFLAEELLAFSVDKKMESTLAISSCCSDGNGTTSNGNNASSINSSERRTSLNKFRELVMANKSLFKSSSTLNSLENKVDKNRMKTVNNIININDDQLNNNKSQLITKPLETLNQIHKPLERPKSNSDDPQSQKKDDIKFKSELKASAIPPPIQIQNDQSENIISKRQSMEEFYQNRLAYDFQTLYEED